MVYEFLIKYQEELTAEKIEKEEDYEMILSKIRENEKFLEMLEQENENIFSDFTPREINYKNAERIKECNSLLEKLYKDKSEAKDVIKKINYRLKELSNVIDEVKNNNTVSSNETPKQSGSDINRLKHDLKNILIFMNQDIERAKIELNDIINKM